MIRSASTALPRFQHGMCASEVDGADGVLNQPRTANGNEDGVVSFYFVQRGFHPGNSERR